MIGGLKWMTRPLESPMNVRTYYFFLSQSQNFLFFLIDKMGWLFYSIIVFFKVALHLSSFLIAWRYIPKKYTMPSDVWMCHVIYMKKGWFYFNSPYQHGLTRSFHTQEEALKKLVGIEEKELSEIAKNIVRYRMRPKHIPNNFRDFWGIIIEHNGREIWVRAKVTIDGVRLIYVPRLPIMICYVK